MSGIAATAAITGGAHAALAMAPARVVGAHTAAHSSPVAAHSPNARAATGFDRQPVAHHQAPQMSMAHAAYHATQTPPTNHADHAPPASVEHHAPQAAAVASVYAAGRS